MARKIHSLLLANLVDSCDMGMTQRGQYPRFAFEASQAERIGSKRLWQDLDRHRSAELRILPSVDLTHAALTELGDDLEMRKRGSDHGAASSCARQLSTRVSEGER